MLEKTRRPDLTKTKIQDKTPYQNGCKAFQLSQLQMTWQPAFIFNQPYSRDEAYHYFTCINLGIKKKILKPQEY